MVILGQFLDLDSPLSGMESTLVHSIFDLDTSHALAEDGAGPIGRSPLHPTSHCLWSFWAWAVAWPQIPHPLSWQCGMGLAKKWVVFSHLGTYSMSSLMLCSSSERVWQTPQGFIQEKPSAGVHPWVLQNLLVLVQIAKWSCPSILVGSCSLRRSRNDPIGYIISIIWPRLILIFFWLLCCVYFKGFLSLPFYTSMHLENFCQEWLCVPWRKCSF